MFSNQVPTLFSLLFLLAFCIPVLLVARLAHRAGIKNGFWKVFIFYVIYLSAVTVASLNGFFDAIMLPPKIVLTTTLPFALFVTLIYMTKVCKDANEVLNLEQLVGIHIFRLIGSTFIILFYHNLLPTGFALFAGIGDVLTAISSVFVVQAIKKQKRYARKLTYVWNTFGLIDIVITSALAIIFTKISIDNNIAGVEFLAEFPFCFIPAFAPPTIIFLHLLVFRKLSRKKIS